jgi:hypothetical protein
MSRVEDPIMGISVSELFKAFSKIQMASIAIKFCDQMNLYFEPEDTKHVVTEEMVPSVKLVVASRDEMVQRVDALSKEKKSSVAKMLLIKLLLHSVEEMFSRMQLW